MLEKLGLGDSKVLLVLNQLDDHVGKSFARHKQGEDGYIQIG
ncbi:MAG: hypothetical protein U5N58_12945 [Actinomycetota bacterium]|nr:hypothetical protein [Actinomycetota bacterium]